MENEKLLFVLRSDEPRWVPIVLKCFKTCFDVSIFAVEQSIKEIGLERTLLHIIALLKNQGIHKVIIATEFFSIFHCGAISILRNYAKTSLIFFDDVHNHLINRVNAIHADFVIVGVDLFESTRYENYSIPAVMFCPENDLSLPFVGDTQPSRDRKIDVFFAGYNHKPGRREFLAAIKRLPLRTLIHETESHGSMPYEVLYSAMRNSKLIINFSRTDHAGQLGYALSFRDPVVFQFKGRLLEAGILGAACISEFFPTIRMNHLEHCVPTFTTTDELLEAINYALEDDRYIYLARQLQTAIATRWSAQSMLERIKDQFSLSSNLQDRRVSICIDASYVKNVALRIQRFRYSNSSVRDADINFFLKFVPGFGYSSIRFRESEDNYPFDV